jgi:hypothetical protein
MKIVELLNNIHVPISNEEASLLGRFDLESEIDKNSLNEREQHLANQLTVQDILHRRNQDGKITYKKKIR